MAEVNKVKCDLCNVFMQNNKDFNEHILGKRHQLALHKQHVVKQKERCSIHVIGLPNLASQADVLSFFAEYGKIVDNFFGTDNRFAIIEYSESEPAEKLQKTEVVFKGKKLRINKRLIKEKDKDETDANDLSQAYTRITEQLKTVPMGSQVLFLTNNLIPNWEEATGRYNLLCCHLQFALSPAFPGCIVYPFGSTVTGLGFFSSDVDIYIQVQKNNAEMDPKGTKDIAASYVNKAAKLLRQNNLFTKVRPIPNAKTPICKCLHVPTNTWCDFNFKNMLGVCNSKLIHYYINLDSYKMRNLLVVIKFWAKIHQLSGSSGRFTNYCLTMMCIFYLQQRPFDFPCVRDLQNSEKVINMQQGWNGGFQAFENLSLKTFRDTGLNVLLYGFFNHYANFDYSLQVVCPYLGRNMFKLDFLKVADLPDEFNLYKINIVDQQPIYIESAICIQDPFEHNHNIARSIPQRHLEDFVAMCRVAAEVLGKQVTNMTLHNLFTFDIESLDIMKTESLLKYTSFKIPFNTKCLILINKKILTEQPTFANNSEKEKYMIAEWHKIVMEFVLKIFIKIFMFEVVIKEVEEEDVPGIADKSSEDSDDNDDRKFQRLSGQADVHDTVSNTVAQKPLGNLSFHCTGKINTWDARQTIAKDININESFCFIDRQIAITEYIVNVLLANVSLEEVIIEFDLEMEALSKEMCFRITKMTSKKNHFKTCVLYISRALPKWFEKYISDCHHREQSSSVNNSAENTAES